MIGKASGGIPGLLSNGINVATGRYRTLRRLTQPRIGEWPLAPSWLASGGTGNVKACRDCREELSVYLGLQPLGNSWLK